MKRNGILILTILLLASFRTGAQTIENFLIDMPMTNDLLMLPSAKGMMNLASSFGSKKKWTRMEKKF
jgi:hypothetical protein